MADNYDELCQLGRDAAQNIDQGRYLIGDLARLESANEMSDVIYLCYTNSHLKGVSLRALNTRDVSNHTNLKGDAMDNHTTISAKRYNKRVVFNVDTSLTRRERAIRAAAFVDSEGSISILRGSQYIYYLKIQVASTTPPMLKWMQDNYAGTIRSKTSRDRHKPCWSWDISGVIAEDFLTEISPFLLIKQAQAQCALEFRKLQGQHMRNIPKEEKVALWYPYWERMKELNTRGR